MENTESIGVMTLIKPMTIPANGCMILYGQTTVKAICQDKFAS